MDLESSLWTYRSALYMYLGKPFPAFHNYSGFSIIRTPIIRIRTFGRRLPSPCFRYQRKKDVAVTGVLLQEKTKLLYERLSRTLRCFFHEVRDLDHDLQRPS